MNLYLQIAYRRVPVKITFTFYNPEGSGKEPRLPKENCPRSELSATEVVDQVPSPDSKIRFMLPEFCSGCSSLPLIQRLEAAAVREYVDTLPGAESCGSCDLTAYQMYTHTCPRDSEGSPTNTPNNTEDSLATESFNKGIVCFVHDVNWSDLSILESPYVASKKSTALSAVRSGGLTHTVYSDDDLDCCAKGNCARSGHDRHLREISRPLAVGRDSGQNFGTIQATHRSSHIKSDVLADPESALCRNASSQLSATSKRQSGLGSSLHLLLSKHGDNLTQRSRQRSVIIRESDSEDISGSRKPEVVDVGASGHSLKLDAKSHLKRDVQTVCPAFDTSKLNIGHSVMRMRRIQRHKDIRASIPPLTPSRRRACQIIEHFLKTQHLPKLKARLRPPKKKRQFTVANAADFKLIPPRRDLRLAQQARDVTSPVFFAPEMEQQQFEALLKQAVEEFVVRKEQVTVSGCWRTVTTVTVNRRSHRPA